MDILRADAEHDRPAQRPSRAAPPRRRAATRSWRRECASGRRRSPPRSSSSPASRRSRRRTCRAGDGRSRSGVPTWTSLPPFSTPTLSPIDIASIWSCVTNRKVAPSLICRSFSSERSVSRSLASRLESGSSIRKMRGERTMARPIETRCISPPERRSTLRSSRWLDAQRLGRAGDALVDLRLRQRGEPSISAGIRGSAAPYSADRANIAAAPARRRARPRPIRRHRCRRSRSCRRSAFRARRSGAASSSCRHRSGRAARRTRHRGSRGRSSPARHGSRRSCVTPFKRTCAMVRLPA